MMLNRAPKTPLKYSSHFTKLTGLRSLSMLLKSVFTGALDLILTVSVKKNTSVAYIFSTLHPTSMTFFILINLLKLICIRGIHTLHLFSWYAIS